jgi:hypothetical protein
MVESIESMIKFIKDHTIIKEYDRYQLFTTLNDDILTDLEQNGIRVVLISKPQNIYIASASSKFVNILRNHKGYQLYAYENRQFLEYATYLIHHNFKVLSSSFMGDILTEFEVEKNVANMVIFKSGMIDSNVNPINYIRSFLESVSYDENKKNIQQT